MKKIVAFLFAAVMALSMTSPVFAATIEENEINGPKYKYQTVYLDNEIVTIEGFAAMPVEYAEGRRFKTGGGFFFIESGGATGSVTLTLTPPAPYDVVSIAVSTNLGRCAGDGEVSGVYVNAPAHPYAYYKVYVTKRIEIAPYITYYKRTGTAYENDPWEVYTKGHTVVRNVDITYEAVVVKIEYD